jgi:NAD(P)-dependent dehydrogenase (short-subunit alcohol dehydrogenase family)
MNIAGKAILVTGSNRGLGRALVDEAVRRGAGRVYAGMRGLPEQADDRMIPVTLDVTDGAQLQQLAQRIESLDLLINNAGIALYDDLTDRALLERHLEVNFYGPYEVTRTFLPLLTRSKGAVVNVLSDSALASVHLVPAYSISKAAAFSMTQSLRPLLAARGVRVHAVLPGPIDTDMSREADIPKCPADTVARRILDAVERGDEDIFPDPVSELVAEHWRRGSTRANEIRRSWQRSGVSA